MIAQVFRLIAALFSTLGGGSGISLLFTPARSITGTRQGLKMFMYYIAFFIALGSVLAVLLLMRSR